MAKPDGTAELFVSPTVRIPLEEIEMRTGPSGGPGGQHANRSHTRVELRFDVAASTALTPTERERVVGRLGPVLRLTVDEHRSQARNRALGYERLAERLAGALVVDPPRRPTKPSKAAQARRLDEKRRQAGRKADRRWSPEG
jgi:ribosome-associated protein